MALSVKSSFNRLVKQDVIEPEVIEQQSLEDNLAEFQEEQHEEAHSEEQGNGFISIEEYRKNLPRFSDLLISSGMTSE